MEGDFQVGPWLIEPSLNAVSHNGESIHLAPKVMGVLVCLAQHAGQSVSKEDLLQTVWPDTFVGDDVLKGSISELRRVLEDDAREPTIIQTIPKRGYRLVAPVQPINGAPEWSTEKRPEAQRGVVSTRKFWMGALTVVAAALLFADFLYRALASLETIGALPLSAFVRRGRIDPSVSPRLDVGACGTTAGGADGTGGHPAVSSVPRPTA